MRKTAILPFTLLAILALLAVPLRTAPTSAQTPSLPRDLQRVPAEVVEAFKDGLTADQLQAHTQGPLPGALRTAASGQQAVIVEMEQPSLIASMLAQGGPARMSAAAQRSYAGMLAQAQAPLAAEVRAAGGTVLGQYTRAYNGLLVLAEADEVQRLSKLPGVKAIHRAPQHQLDLAQSVPLIGAPDVWAGAPGYDGAGVRIAIIDSGIDYTHAAFGGSGTAAAYTGNNPKVIEPGTFPTVKVAGGYDFAGSNYDASGESGSKVPIPDPDPLDESGHGTHVASIAAGQEVLDGSSNVLVGSGVAPGASLYALKVFGRSGSTNLVVNALEWAIDPNGDGDLSDRMDVINLSLGSFWGAADSDDPEQEMIDLITSLGTLVVAASGNESDSAYITGAPAVADGALSVAASTTGYAYAPVIRYDGGAQKAPYEPGNAFTTALTAPLVDVDVVDGGAATGELCTPTVDNPATDLAGKIALIQRGGECSFAVKIANAATLGAAAAIIFNAASTEYDELVLMETGATSLPAAHTLYTAGTALKAFHNTSVTIGPDSQRETAPAGLPDRVASLSSRGPRGYDSKLKPEITAPGLGIVAAALGSGNQGVSFSGTSMATPHVAGAAALVRQAHPDWNAEQVKAALMNSAADLDPGDANGYRVVPRTGAGRVDAFDAVYTETLLMGDPQLVSLSWGVVEVGVDTPAYAVPQAKTLRVENLAATSKTYNVTVTFSDPAMTGATLNLPATITVPAGGTGSMTVTLTIDPDQLPMENELGTERALNFGVMEEYYGFVTLTPQGGGSAARAPFYFVPRPYSSLSEAPGATKDVYPGASITFNQSGPKTSNLNLWPALQVDPNEPAVNDTADLRAVGFDYFGEDVDYGSIIAAVMAYWGPIYDPITYFAQTQIDIDADRDGLADSLLFNYNLGAWLGEDEDNQWIVLRYDYAARLYYLGSPYFIVADYNSGVQEWYLPVTDLGLVYGDFDYQFFSLDETETGLDVLPTGSFDYARRPFTWTISDLTPGGGASTTLTVDLFNLGGYRLANPVGVMLVDYYGRPGIGQVSVIPLTAGVPTLYLPIIRK